MKKITISAIILVVILSIAGCTTERYAEYMRERPAPTDTLSMMKKQDEVSLSQDRDKYYYYPRCYRLFFAN